MNTPKSTGEAWDKLEEKVDSLVEALIEEKSLPGMTVAVTKGGGLSYQRATAMLSWTERESYLCNPFLKWRERIPISHVA